MVQWLRICLPMQGTRVQALVWEDPTCCGATKSAHHHYWACALEPASQKYWVHTPQLLKPTCSNKDPTQPKKKEKERERERERERKEERKKERKKERGRIKKSLLKGFKKQNKTRFTDHWLCDEQGRGTLTSDIMVSFHCTHLVISKMQRDKESGKGFPGGAVVKNLPANAGDTGSSFRHKL